MLSGRSCGNVTSRCPGCRGAGGRPRRDLFLDALTQEMVPFIGANYRTIPSISRCLYGYSSSGFFVLYALFHRPDAFRRYLSGSGDLYIAYPYLIQHAEQLGDGKLTTQFSSICPCVNWKDFSFLSSINSSLF